MKFRGDFGYFPNLKTCDRSHKTISTKSLKASILVLFEGSKEKNGKLNVCSIIASDIANAYWKD